MAYHKITLIGGLVSVYLGLASAVYADPWSENATSIYTTDPNKSVGIGTAYPDFKLDVEGTSAVTAQITTTGANQYAQLR
ncbi:MAG: hypothetical protein ACD_41C00330G0001, partial [uncultured bacterium]